MALADALCGETAALPDELISAAQAHFDDQQLAEILLVAGQANLNNRVGNAAKQIVNLPED